MKLRARLVGTRQLVPLAHRTVGRLGMRVMKVCVSSEVVALEVARIEHENTIRHNGLIMEICPAPSFDFCEKLQKGREMFSLVGPVCLTRSTHDARQLGRENT